MNVWNDILASNGRFYAFQRRHPDDKLAGRKGVFALIGIEGFTEFRVLYVEASNDLAEVEGGRVKELPVYNAAKRLGFTVVAILQTGKASDAYRENLAERIREQQAPVLNCRKAA